MKLKDSQVKAAKPREKLYRVSDGEGLYLEVSPTGAKLWRYRYRLAGKENMASLGKYPRVSLTDARKRRDDAQTLVEAGIHPAQYRKTQRREAEYQARNTFEAVAREWMTEAAPHWSARYLENVELYMRNDVFPRIGGLPIKAVKAADVLAILKGMADRGAETAAGLVRMWCSQVFKYAVRNLLADADPCEVLKGAVRRPAVKHHRALEPHEIGRLVLALEAYGGYRETALAVHLLLLTFVRPGELLGAEWAEFDLERALWVIPAERMKMGDPHKVPLSAQAVALLQELHTLTGSRPLVLPGQFRPTKQTGLTTVNAALERLKVPDFSAHGFRATASTLLNANGYTPDVIERQLAHKERNTVRASYNHHEYMTERAAMMQAWADMVDTYTLEARESRAAA